MCFVIVLKNWPVQAMEAVILYPVGGFIKTFISRTHAQLPTQQACSWVLSHASLRSLLGSEPLWENHFVVVVVVLGRFLCSSGWPQTLHYEPEITLKF